MASKARTYQKTPLIEPKKLSNEVDLSPVGRAFNTILSDDTKRKEESLLSRGERNLLLRERKRQEERKPNRAGYDIGAELKDRIANLANAQGVSKSQLVAWILWGGIKELERSQCIELKEYKQPSNNLQHEWQLDLEKRKNE